MVELKINTIQCRICGRVKEAVEFGIDRSKKNGRATRCKDCARICRFLPRGVDTAAEVKRWNELKNLGHNDYDCYRMLFGRNS